MAERIYRTDRIAVSWRPERCIHSQNCIRGLPGVFDPQRRPWIEVEGADADKLARVIELCPTGALAYERLDGGPAEEPERPTRVIPATNGPLVLRGDLRVETPDGDLIAHETRLTLCRCGATGNQPFCDNTHLRIGFESGPPHAPSATEGDSDTDTAGDDPTTIVPIANGPLRVRGRISVETTDGEALGEATNLLLCRCGRSANKPFCDSSHKRAGFRSTDPDVKEHRRSAASPAAFLPNPEIGSIRT